VNIRLVKKPSEAEKPAAFVHNPIKKNEEAPPWGISEWTDGKEHVLADFRGQVVVIEFWGVWCGPCVNSIPVMKKLHEKFAGQAAFVGIHTAGTDMSQVKKLLALKEWNVLVGLDKGPEITKGETVGLYRVRGFPTVMVVDKRGGIAFNSDEITGDQAKVMEKMKAFAEEIGIPWPIDKGASEDEIHARLERMQEHMFTKEIEQALAN
jgi:thiol-disulfide isomerase/thioredoxin